MKLKYNQMTFRAFNHRRRRIRKKYFHILIKTEKKAIGKKKKPYWDIWTYKDNIEVWESFLDIEREKGRSRRPKHRSSRENKTYEIKIYLSGWFYTITFCGTEEEMKRFVDIEAMAYCVRGIEVTHRGVTCYTKANLSYNFDTDSDEDSDVGYVDLYEIFPRLNKEEK